MEEDSPCLRAVIRQDEEGGEEEGGEEEAPPPPPGDGTRHSPETSGVINQI